MEVFNINLTINTAVSIGCCGYQQIAVSLTGC